MGKSYHGNIFPSILDIKYQTSSTLSVLSVPRKKKGAYEMPSIRHSICPSFHPSHFYFINTGVSEWVMGGINVACNNYGPWTTDKLNGAVEETGALLWRKLTHCYLCTNQHQIWHAYTFKQVQVQHTFWFVKIQNGRLKWI